jgi:hypothetical protein
MQRRYYTIRQCSSWSKSQQMVRAVQSSLLTVLWFLRPTVLFKQFPTALYYAPFLHSKRVSRNMVAELECSIIYLTTNPALICLLVLHLVL